MQRESVWDYPRPPRVEPTSRRIRVELGGQIIAETTRAVRVLETSHPPVYYISRADIRVQSIAESKRQTFCEFKGTATYWTIDANGKVVENVAWSYEDPEPGFAGLRGMLAFYPSKVDRCLVDDDVVSAQAGSFYGGWITSDIDGPFKG